LNQMFRSGEYKDLKVQSFQLEFRMIGCRDNDEILKSTARNFINAISALIPSKENIPVEKTIEPTDKKNQRADKAQVPEKITDPAEIKDAIDVGGHGYDPLIEKAYQKLSNIFSKNYEQALMEAGQYIVRTFYAGEEAVEDLKYDENLVLDPAVIENARSNNSPRKTSLHQLCKKLNENSGSKAPSQAWIYNAVDLIVQWQDMKNKLKNDFYTYRNLLLSHKVCLLRIKDIEIKKAFIGQILEKELSVRKLKELITESKKQPNKEKSMYSVINEPDELFSEKYSEQFKLKELNKIRVDKLKKMQSKMLEQCKIFEVSRMNYADESYKCDRYVKKYLDVLTDFNTVIKFKENPSKDKKLKKSKTKMARP
ncbi:MAG: hypothetical protein KKH99_00990, partial [Proteobacteria bacterium]|nr:hypothetical protein [Pseudomonadota bacterium]